MHTHTHTPTVHVARGLQQCNQRDSRRSSLCTVPPSNPHQLKMNSCQFHSLLCKENTHTYTAEQSRLQFPLSAHCQSSLFAQTTRNSTANNGEHHAATMQPPEQLPVQLTPPPPIAACQEFGARARILSTVF